MTTREKSGRGTFAVAAVLLLDTTAYAVVLPTLSLSYGSGFAVGALFGLYSLCQLLAAPVLGRLSDRHGRRPVLAGAQIGTIASLLLLGVPGYLFSVLSRAMDGVTAGNAPVASAAALDANPRERWPRVIGLLGSASGAGVLVGVGLASLTDGGLRSTALLGASIAGASLVVTLVCVPAGVPVSPTEVPRLSLALLRRCRVALLAGTAQAASIMGLPALLVALEVPSRTAIRYGFYALLFTAAVQTFLVPFLLRLRRGALAGLVVALAVSGVLLLGGMPILGSVLLLSAAVTVVAQARVVGTLALAEHGAGLASGMMTTASTAGQLAGPLILFAALQLSAFLALVVVVVLFLLASAATLEGTGPALAS